MRAGPVQEGLGIFIRSLGAGSDESEEVEIVVDGKEKDDVEFHVRMLSPLFLVLPKLTHLLATVR
jgi:hypothetical protein